jgi:4'-phosphopantetheinyl transferase
VELPLRLSARPWKPPPTVLTLDADEVHVWRVDVGSTYARRDPLWSFLAGDERQRAADFLFEGDRERFVVARGVLRALLGCYLRQHPGSLGFGYNPHGKPNLAGDSEIRFSTSHSHGLVLLAFARGREVGVDIERVRADLGLEEIAACCFSPREIATLHALQNGLRERAFFACWTRREALAKAEGRGLTFRSFGITPAPVEPAMLPDTGKDSPEPAKWTLEELDLDPGYAAALCVEGNGLRLSCWQYTEGVCRHGLARRGPIGGMQADAE